MTSAQGHGIEHRARVPGDALKKFFVGRSLGECIESGRDNILHVRLLAALMVVLGHSGVAGAARWPYDIVHSILPATFVHIFGLFTFFLLSGMLITLSYVRRPSLPRFLWARFLRIWPALAVCVLTLAFVLGPIISELPPSDYFAFDRADSPYRYALHGLSVFHIVNALPGVFVHAPVNPREVDTPLWTISIESTLYLWVAGAGILRLFRVPWLTSALVAALFSWLMLWPMSQGRFHYMSDVPLTVKAFFGVGVIACLLRSHVRISSGVMLVIAIAQIFANGTAHAVPFTFLTTVYFVLWLAYVPKLPAIPGRADLSYGTYLWAWPIEQGVATIGGVHTPTLLFAIAAPLAMAVALLSWNFVEKPALRLKDRYEWREGRLVRRAKRPAAAVAVAERTAW